MVDQLDVNMNSSYTQIRKGHDIVRWRKPTFQQRKPGRASTVDRLR